MLGPFHMGVVPSDLHQNAGGVLFLRKSCFFNKTLISVWVQIQKTFFEEFCCKFLAFLAENAENDYFPRVWHAQRPKAGQNIQQ